MRSDSTVPLLVVSRQYDKLRMSRTKTRPLFYCVRICFKGRSSKVTRNMQRNRKNGVPASVLCSLSSVVCHLLPAVRHLSSVICHLSKEGWSFFVFSLWNPLGALDFEVWRFLQERYRKDWNKGGLQWCWNGYL